MSLAAGAARNIRLYPWFRFLQGLIFWQAIWFLYFQSELSAADAILLYAVFDVSATALEVPLGYMSDRVGRRITLILSGLSGAAAALMMALGASFEVFALANVLLGAWAALNSGTDSAFLYESLRADGREDEVEAQELRAWRFSFTALAISAASGGLMAAWSGPLPYYGVTLALLASVWIAWLFEENEGTDRETKGAELAGTVQAITATLKKPVLVWLFVLSLSMYIYSHIPFVFGQPFILEALKSHGLDGEAPVISGGVTAIMMVISVMVSLVALRVRRLIGLPLILLAAFFMQITLAGVLALTNSAIAIAFLFLRMVPDSLSKPFILARIQPELGDQTRATYLSLQSFCGRLIFAASLYLASLATSSEAQMAHSEIRGILGWYVLVGVLTLLGLAVAARKVDVEGERSTHA